MAAGYPSGYNTFVPSFEASGKLVVAYSRNPKDFALNRYVQIIPVKKSLGYFLKLTAANAARVLSTTATDFIWPDGNDAPTGEWNTESHLFVSYQTDRYAFPVRLGYKAVAQADWPILAVHAGNAAQQAMTARTQNVINTMVTTGNWNSNHVAATGTASPGGASLSSGTGTNPVLKKALNGMAQQIQKDTLGVIKPRDLMLVISPTVADPLGRSQEVHQFLANSPFALAQVRGDAPNQNGIWGLPDAIYGFPIVVEDAVLVNTRKGAALAPSYLLGSQLLFLARPGGLVSEGSSSFGSVGLFMYEEMTVESKDDPDNRRHSTRVVDDYAVNILSEISGYLITNCLS